MEYKKITTPQNYRWFFFDTEFVDYQDNHVFIQFAYKIYLNNKVIEEADFYLNPQIELPKFVTRITGITDEILLNQGYEYQNGIEKILQILLRHYQNVIFVGHGLQNDFHLLFRIVDQMENLQSPVYLNFRQLWNDNVLRIYDIQESEKFLAGNQKQRKLAFLMNQYDVFIDTEELHNALYDIKAIKLIFEAQSFKWFEQFNYLPLIFMKKINREEQAEQQTNENQN